MRFLFLSIGFVTLAAVSACKDFANETPNWKALEAAAEKGDSISLAQLRAGAERGDAKAQFQLGYFYAYHQVIEDEYKPGGGVFTPNPVQMADYAEAEKLWRRAAEQGDPVAPQMLGELATTPFGKSGRTEQEAVAEEAKWYRLAAERGRTEAQYQLGDIYIMQTLNSSIEHEKDPHTVSKAEAFKWLRTAAQHGHAESQYWLAALYIEPKLGLAAPDYAEAYFWVTVCAKKLEGCQPDVLNQYLNPAQMAALKKRAAEWKPLPTNSAGQ